MWNLSALPSFRGFDEQQPVRIYHRHMPHWRQEGVAYFVTFRLADALPQSKLRELAAVRDEWIRNVGRSSAPSYKRMEGRSDAESFHSKTGRSTAPSYGEKRTWQEISQDWIDRVEQWLDEGMGSCVLRSQAAAAAVEQCLRHDDGKNYELIAYVVMPNHVHVLARPDSDAKFPLEKLEQAWKSFSAREINRLLGASGMVWQEESFDRIVRDEEHLFRCIQYIGSNARRAGLGDEDCLRYVNERWLRAGWGFQDDV